VLRDHHGHVVVQDLDRQDLACLAKNFLLFTLDDGARPVVRVHHLVADLVQTDSLSRVVKAPALVKTAGGAGSLPKISVKAAFFQGFWNTPAQGGFWMGPAASA